MSIAGAAIDSLIVFENGVRRKRRLVAFCLNVMLNLICPIMRFSVAGVTPIVYTIKYGD